MLKTFSLTDIGKKRTMNQDFVYTSETPVGNLPNLFIVADGMGGYNGGDLASSFAVETIIDSITASDQTEPNKLFSEAISKANSEVRRKAGESPDLSGMGTTVVCATCIDDCLHVANVGDSRLYIVTPSKIIQVTVDHSYVEEMIRMGELDRASARNHPKKNVITRAVGAYDSVEADCFKVKLTKDSTILMCSDGLTNMLEDEEIRILLQGQRDIVEKAEELIKAANANGGKDNIAVVLVEPFADDIK